MAGDFSSQGTGEKHFCLPGRANGYRLWAPQIKNVEAIQEWPLPLTKVQQVPTFVGLTSYYWRFIPHFISLASPLTDLTRDRLPAWTEETEKAFHDLKVTLFSGHVMVALDFVKPLVVQSDVSETGVGAVCCHNYNLARSCCRGNQNIPQWRRKVSASLESWL